MLTVCCKFPFPLRKIRFKRKLDTRWNFQLIRCLAALISLPSSTIAMNFTASNYRSSLRVREFLWILCVREMIETWVCRNVHWGKFQWMTDTRWATFFHISGDSRSYVDGRKTRGKEGKCMLLEPHCPGVALGNETGINMRTETLQVLAINNTVLSSRLLTIHAPWMRFLGYAFLYFIRTFAQAESKRPWKDRWKTRITWVFKWIESSDGNFLSPNIKTNLFLTSQSIKPFTPIDLIENVQFLWEK